MDRNALGVFGAVCALALALFALGLWKHSAPALVGAIILFILAPFVFGLRTRA